MRSRRAATTKKAWASIANVTQRYQDRQQRTWCWSRPTRPLPVWKHSSMVQRLPATRTRVASGAGRGRVAAVEGQLAGPLVAAEHEPVLSGPPARRRLTIEAKERPVVQAMALGAPAGRHALPCSRWDMGEQGVGGVAGATEVDRVVAGHRQHVADASALHLGPQPGLAP